MLTIKNQDALLNIRMKIVRSTGVFLRSVGLLIISKLFGRTRTERNLIGIMRYQIFEFIY